MVRYHFGARRWICMQEKEKLRARGVSGLEKEGRADIRTSYILLIEGSRTDKIERWRSRLPLHCLLGSQRNEIVRRQFLLESGVMMQV